MSRSMRPTSGATDSHRLSKPSPTSGNGDSRRASDEAIARRAYEIYQSRGGMHGADLDDWLEAERQLRPGPRSVAGPTRPPARKRKAPEETGAE
jgi:DUF2934 family protein